MKSAGGIENNKIVAVIPGVGKCLFGSLDRILRSLFKDGRTRLFADDFKLIYGGGTVYVASHKQGAVSF